jgi:3-methyladenine DNA glycosylase AlkD
MFETFIDNLHFERISSTADARRISALNFKYITTSLPIDDILCLCERLLEKRIWSHDIIAFDWAFRCRAKYRSNLFDKFEKWLYVYVRDWGGCDDFCTHAFGELLRQYPECFDRIITWTNNPNFWIKRAAAVILIYPIKKGSFSFEEVTTICNLLKSDTHHLVQKATGWLLKEYSILEPELVYNYLVENVNQLSRTTFRYALQKYEKDMRKYLMSL